MLLDLHHPRHAALHVLEGVGLSFVQQITFIFCLTCVLLTQEICKIPIVWSDEGIRVVVVLCLVAAPATRECFKAGTH